VNNSGQKTQDWKKESVLHRPKAYKNQSEKKTPAVLTASAVNMDASFLANSCACFDFSSLVTSAAAIVEFHA
jgi:hypothetical protein